MPSRLTGFVCPTVSMVTTGHATGVEKTLLVIIILDSEAFNDYKRFTRATVANKKKIG